MTIRVVASVLGAVVLVGGVALIEWRAGLIIAGLLLLLAGLLTEVTDATDR